MKTKRNKPITSSEAAQESRGWSISRAAGELGRDRRTVAAAVRNLRPIGSDRGSNLYRLGDIAIALAGRQTEGVDYAEARRRRMLAEARIAEIELARLEGSSIDIEVVVAPLTEQCSIIRNRFLSLPTRCSHRVAGLDERGAYTVLYQAVVDILRELSADADVRAKAAALTDHDDTAKPTEGDEP